MRLFASNAILNVRKSIIIMPRVQSRPFWPPENWFLRVVRSWSRSHSSRTADLKCFWCFMWPDACTAQSLSSYIWSIRPNYVAFIAHRSASLYIMLKQRSLYAEHIDSRRGELWTRVITRDHSTKTHTRRDRRRPVHSAQKPEGRLLRVRFDSHHNVTWFLAFFEIITWWKRFLWKWLLDRKQTSLIKNIRYNT